MIVRVAEAHAHLPPAPTPALSVASESSATASSTDNGGGGSSAGAVTAGSGCGSLPRERERETCIDAASSDCSDEVSANSASGPQTPERPLDDMSTTSRPSADRSCTEPSSSTSTASAHPFTSPSDSRSGSTPTAAPEAAAAAAAGRRERGVFVDKSRRQIAVRVGARVGLGGGARPALPACGPLATLAMACGSAAPQRLYSFDEVFAPDDPLVRHAIFVF